MQARSEYLRLWFAGFFHKFTSIERGIVSILVLAILVSTAQLTGLRNQNTQIIAADGGVHIEGVVGSPRYINPVLAGTNQVDLDIAKLVYSGLVKVSPAREVMPDLAASWNLTNEDKTYIFNLRPDVKWHDGQDFTSDDVVYTFNVLQNNDYTGVLKSNFQGVTVERLDDHTVQFTLPAPSSFFLYDLDIGIIPEHIYRQVAVRDLASFYRPGAIIGTGPFQYDGGISNQSVTLKKYTHFYGIKPHLEKVVFYFYENERTLQTAFKNRAISAAGLLEEPTIAAGIAGDQQFNYQLPQYRAIFFNQLGDNQALKDVSVRQALAYATDKLEIVEQVENNHADVVDSPILPGFWGHKDNIKKYDFNLNQAATILKNAGWADVDGDGILEKDNVRLSFKLSTRQDLKLNAIAKLLAHNWTILGAQVDVDEVDTASFIKDVVRPRNYDALLFGQDLGGNSDPYVYWHSSQITDPGLALAVTIDKDLDNNLESARLSATVNQSIGAYLRFQDAFAQLVPAILLYTPRYTYIVDSKLKGVTDQINLSSLSDRFATIEQWYVRTKRTAMPDPQTVVEEEAQPEQ